jgi:hypothetical protein
MLILRQMLDKMESYDVELTILSQMNVNWIKHMLKYIGQ